ncbi:MAG TPA: hypothetical protein VFH46_00535 [Pyrinomonadaceae bacterium]|nr:hypothetical protein [Pyrinomonadaceae bacterium]
MPALTRLYASIALTFGGQPAIRDLIAAKYNSIIIWTVHVDTDGTLFLNNTKIVSRGVYKEAWPMNLPSCVAQLRKAGMEIIFSVGSGETSDFRNIETLLNGKPGTQGNIIFDNFLALKNAMVTAGGDIDAIDIDNEDNPKAEVMINFGITMANIKYSHVTFCPAGGQQMWYDTMSGLVKAKGSAFVNAIHLQCYSGGRWNDPAEWKAGFQNAGGNALMIAGLATNQSSPGPWWNGDTKSPGASIHKVTNVAMSAKANWENYLYTQNFPTIMAAFQGAQTAASFFFYCRGPLVLSNGRSFNTGDAVFFMGSPTWGTASQCDSYFLGTPCKNIYNNNMTDACPRDVQAQFHSWRASIDGGFIWYYDSIISCYLAACCGGSMDQPTTTALAYREAITNALT